MKLESPQIILPWEDTDGSRQYSRLDFTGVVDVRRVRRMLRRFCIKHLGSHPKNAYLDAHVKRSIVIKQCVEKVYVTNDIVQAFTNALEMSDEEYNTALLEADSQAATSIQDDGGPREAEREVPVVQSGPDEDGTQESLCRS